MSIEYRREYYKNHADKIKQTARDHQKASYADQAKREEIKARNRARYKEQRDAIKTLKSILNKNKVETEGCGNKVETEG